MDENPAWARARESLQQVLPPNPNIQTYAAVAAAQQFVQTPNYGGYGLVGYIEIYETR